MAKHKFTFDATKAQGAVASITATLLKHNTAVKQVTGSYVDFNSQGKGLQATFDFITTSGGKGSVSLKDFGKGLEVVKVNMKNTASEAKALEAQLKKLENLKRVKSVESFLDSKFSKVKNDPDVANLEKLRLDKLRQNALRTVARGNMDVGQFQYAFDQIRKGSKQTFGFLQEDARIAIGRMIKELDSLETKMALGKTRKGTASAIDAAMQAARGEFNKIKAGLPGNLTDNMKTTLDGYMTSALRVLKSGKVDQAQFNKVFEVITKGAKHSLDETEEIMRVRLQRIFREAEKLQAKGAKIGRQVGVAPWLKAVTGTVQNKLGPIDAAASTANINRINVALQRIKQNMLDSGVTFPRFQQIMDKTFQNTGDMFLGVEGKIQRAIRSIMTEYEKAAKEGKKVADAALTERTRKGQSTLVRDSLENKFPVKGLRGDTGAMERTRNTFTRIQTAMEKGSITYKNYLNAMASLDTGATKHLTSTEHKIHNMLKRVDRDFDEAGKGIKIFGKTTSGALKLLASQVAFDYFSRIVYQMKHLVQEAVEFNRVIALSQTISQDANLGFNEWAEGIKHVSDELGKPIMEVAAANYDALSNQVTHAADSFAFLTDAGEFALATNSSVADSVNLISSAINSYRLSAADAKNVSEIFFETIDYGRVTASEMSGSFGRVAVLAESAGIQLDELGASVAFLTQQGIKYDEAFTLLNNTIIKLLNPTEKLQKYYDELGVGTGEAFTKTYTFIGALQKLQDETGGSSAAIADFFNEIRGFRGASNLTGGLDKVTDILDKMRNSSDSYAKAIDLTKENPGQRFIREFNKIENFFLIDFKNSILNGVVAITEYFGGLYTITKALIPTIIGLAAAFAGLSVAANAGSIMAYVKGLHAMRGALNAVKLAMGPVGWAIIAAGAVIGAVTYWALARKELGALAEQSKKTARELAELGRAKFAESITEKVNAFGSTLDGYQSRLLAFIADERTALQDRVNNHETAFNEIQGRLKNQGEIILGSLRGQVEALNSSVNAAVADIQKLKDIAKDIETESSTRRFDRELAVNDINVSNRSTYAEIMGLDPELYSQKFDNSGKIIEKRIESLRKQSLAAAATGDIDGTVQIFQEINKLLDDYATKTKKVPIYDQFGRYTGKKYDYLAHADGEKKIGEEAQRQLSILDQIGKKKAIQAEADRQQLEVQKQLVKTLEDLVEKIGKFTTLDSNGKLSEEFTNIAAAMKSIAGMQNEFQSALKGTPGIPDTVRKNLLDESVTLQELFAEQNAALQKQAQLATEFDQLTKSQERLISDIENAKRNMKELADDAIKANDELLKVKERMTGVFLELSKVAGGAIDGDPITQYFRKMTGDLALPEAGEAFVAVAEEIKKLGTDEGNIDKTREQLVNLRSELEQWNELNRGELNSIFDKIVRPATDETPAFRVKDMLVQIDNFLTLMAEKNEQRKPKMDLFTGQLETANGFAGILDRLEIGFTGVADSSEASGVRIQSAFSIMADATNPVFQKLHQLEATFNRLLSKQALLNSGGGGAIEAKASGGMVGQFYGGSMKRGKDNRMILAQDGEMVINADATRQFYSQLVAINRGQTPKGGDGASMTTVNVGGINVHGGNTNRQTAAEISNQLSRAVRRGTIKVGK